MTINILEKLKNGDYHTKSVFTPHPAKPCLNKNCSALEAEDFAKKMHQYEIDLELAKQQNKLYYKEIDECINKFMEDAIASFDFKRKDEHFVSAIEAMKSIAWENGHAYGLQEVYNHMIDLSQILDIFDKEQNSI